MLRAMVSLSILQRSQSSDRYTLHHLIREFADTFAKRSQYHEMVRYARGRFVEWMLAEMEEELRLLSKRIMKNNDPIRFAALHLVDMLNFQEMLKRIPAFPNLHKQFLWLRKAMCESGQYAFGAAMNKVTLKTKKNRSHRKDFECLARIDHALPSEVVSRHGEASFVQGETMEWDEIDVGPTVCLCLDGHVRNIRKPLPRRHDYKRKAKQFLVIALKGSSIRGPSHPKTLAAWESLAWTLGILGRHIEEAQVLEKIVKVKTRIMGPLHPEVLRARHNFACSLGLSGKHAEEAHMLREIVGLGNIVFGSEHPTTLASKHNLANAFGFLGKHSEELSILRDVIDIKNKYFGSRHPSILISGHNLAMSIGLEGFVEEAPGREKVMEIMKLLWGGSFRCAACLTSRHDLAYTLASLGRHVEQAWLGGEILGIENKTSGGDVINNDKLLSRQSLTKIMAGSVGHHSSGVARESCVFDFVMRIRPDNGFV